MRHINISTDILPIGEFKTSMAKVFAEIKENHAHLVITQNGRAAGVLMSPEEYDNLRDSKLFTDSVVRGIKDADEGRVFTKKEVLDKLKLHRD